MAGRICLLTLFLLSSIPTFAEVDLTGNWVARQHQDWQERGPGPEPVDYLGLPINEEARAKALLYTASMIAMPERQCLYYTPAYVVLGPQSIRMWAENDPVSGKTIAWKISAAIDRTILTIWMDGRPHPPDYAPHTFSGFTTGEWEGDVLVMHTTHMKAGYIRRNGVPSSDQATATARIMRHGDLLTITQFVEDLIYLTEPFVISRVWQMDPHTEVSPVPRPCTPVVEVIRLGEEGNVPHYLPGKNPLLNEVTRLYNIPRETVMGGAETAYPEYRKKLKDTYVAPVKCTRYCCGIGGGGGLGNPFAAALGCIGDGTGEVDRR